MNEINYVTGSALEPIGEGKKIVCHVCNDVGAWGAGFVLAISAKWPYPELDYKAWHRHGAINGNEFRLGKIEFTRVTDILYDEGKSIHVCNMIAQTGLESAHPTIPPISYDALHACLTRVAWRVQDNREAIFGASVHMPRVGCGLAGGKWEKIKEIIKKTLVAAEIPTYVYTLEGDTSWRE